jgi:hypothetical protein
LERERNGGGKEQRRRGGVLAGADVRRKKEMGLLLQAGRGGVELVSLGKRGTTFYCPYCAAVRLAAVGSRDGALLAVRSEQLGQKRLLPHFSPFSSFWFLSSISKILNFLTL